MRWAARLGSALSLASAAGQASAQSSAGFPPADEPSSQPAPPAPPAQPAQQQQQPYPQQPPTQQQYPQQQYPQQQYPQQQVSPGAQQWVSPVPRIPQPVLPPAPPGTCSDKRPSEYETDVDCGGVCDPCAIEQRCVRANDCVSGLCWAGQCHEREYVEGDPIPEGYELKPSARDRASTARWMGIGTFGLAYGASYVGALSAPTLLSWLYVPILGPWPLLDDVGQFTTDQAERPVKALLVADGVMQVAGLTLWLGSTLLRKQQLLKIPRETTLAQPPLVVAYDVGPFISKDGYGLSLQGVF